jgi:hypothetical protein
MLSGAVFIDPGYDVTLDADGCFPEGNILAAQLQCLFGHVGQAGTHRPPPMHFSSSIWTIFLTAVVVIVNLLDEYRQAGPISRLSVVSTSPHQDTRGL